MRTEHNQPVIAGLDPAIEGAPRSEAVDARVNPRIKSEDGHDDYGVQGNE
jgi:hypothetical protein